MSVETRERVDDVLGWLLLAIGLTAPTFVISAIVFVVTYLRSLGLWAAIAAKGGPAADPQLLDAANGNDAICFVAAIAASASGVTGLICALLAAFRWQNREGPTYPTGG